MQNMRLLRKQKHITLQEMAKSLNTSHQVLQRYETGKHEPDLAMLTKLADYFGVSVDYLIGRKGASAAPFGSAVSQLTEEESELLRNYRRVSENSKRNIFSLAEVLANAEDPARNVNI